MNLVVGASGLLGSEICRTLRESSRPARALVRKTTDATKQEKLKSMSVNLVYGDLKEPSTLSAALQDVSTVISTASATFSRQTGDSIETVDSRGQLSLIESAMAAGVGHFIFISFPPMAEDFGLQRAKRSVEEQLVKSGLAYTVLQPTFFEEIWLSPAVGFEFSNARARLYGSGINKISWISYLDVAAFAVASVENPAARNAILKMGGPEALSPLGVVKIFEEVGGRQFAVEHVPEEALLTQKTRAADALEEAFAALMLGYAQGQVIDMREANEIFPSMVGKLTSVREYAKHVLSVSTAGEPAHA